MPFALVLGLVVTIHELGHFLAGQELRRWPSTGFSIGFGRAIASKKIWTDRSGVEWRVRLDPAEKGSYVRFSRRQRTAASVPDHEDLESPRRSIERSRRAPPPSAAISISSRCWQRAIVVAAGPLSPTSSWLITAVRIALLMAFGQYVLPARASPPWRRGSPAERAGFRAGDMIVEADGRRITRALTKSLRSCRSAPMCPPTSWSSAGRA